MSSVLSEFLYSPQGMILIAGIGLFIGVLYAYKKNKSDIDREERDKTIYGVYYNTIKRHGHISHRNLIKDGKIIGKIYKEDNKSYSNISKEIEKNLPNDYESKDYDGQINKFLVYRDKPFRRFISSLPVLRKFVLDVYLVSKDKVRSDNNSIVLDNNTYFDKFCGIWSDFSAESVSDIYHIHGLDLLKENMEGNKEFSERMINLDPQTARQRSLVKEEYERKSEMFHGKKQNRHG